MSIYCDLIFEYSNLVILGVKKSIFGQKKIRFDIVYFAQKFIFRIFVSFKFYFYNAVRTFYLETPLQKKNWFST